MPKLRDLGIKIGHYKPGPLNTITDVVGTRVGHATLHYDEGMVVARTGVTAILPCEDVFSYRPSAAAFVVNGTGELTGIAELNRFGRLSMPILLTDTSNVGRVYDGAITYMIKSYPHVGTMHHVVLPVVGEVDNSALNNSRYRHVMDADVVKAIESAQTGPVLEGAVGAGTGSIAFGFKSGIGTSSRYLPNEEGGFTIGALVLSNHSHRDELLIDGVPVGREIVDLMPQFYTPEGSIIIILATDAPLEHRQLIEMAKRAIVGLARTGSTIRNNSGDFILAFSSTNVISYFSKQSIVLQKTLADRDEILNPIFRATSEVTEEAIINALTCAETTIGRNGNTAHAIPLDQLVEVMRKYNRSGAIKR
ncbi:TPA: S58 family peptidase [Candidatus Poribacteria bacterium]|nr:S58 family peptidase [Candidatus Poribacteria bacterium]